MVETIATHLNQYMAAIDLSLQSIDGDPETPATVISRSPAEMHGEIRRIQSMTPGMQGLGVIDRNGVVIASAQTKTPAPTNLSDRPFFQQHRDDPSVSMLIGSAVHSRPDNKLSIPVSRRLEDQAGQFAGVIAGRLDPEYFAVFFRSADVDVISMSLLDGTILSRYPAVDLLSVPKISQDSLQKGLSDVDRIVSPVDGVKRILLARKLTAAPLIVRAGFDESRITRNWLRKSTTVLALYVVVVVLTLVIGVSAQLRFKAISNMLRVQAEAEQIAVQARQDAIDQNIRKSEFLAHMSHEIRTPLNAIIGFSQMISGEILGSLGNKKYREYALDILYSGEHLLSVINDILDMAKIDAGKWQLDASVIRLEVVLQAVMRLARQRAQHEGVELHMLPQEKAISVNVDERTLRQALLNLVVNAIKFTGRGNPVTLSAAITANGGVELVVVDQGPGMSAAEVERVLQPFESGSSREARMHSDTGLGLPLAKRFIEMHGGSLQISSQPGHGTSARLVLPASRVVYAPERIG